MPLEPRASWFSPKCVEAQQLTGHLGVKHCFGAGRESGTKSRQTLNTRYDLKITGVKVVEEPRSLVPATVIATPEPVLVTVVVALLFPHYSFRPDPLAHAPLELDLLP
ncbi:hypothetical protein LWI28_002970 [Acer negundo]|uniref:Uncharacterized protein n=1 Tax=Acer negundo TaxID=4023 RepID=A0AAD5NW75_ACENE|nr:hypothetical protein LWI28_002970 [Acer negundo]